MLTMIRNLPIKVWLVAVLYVAAFIYISSQFLVEVSK